MKISLWAASVFLGFGLLIGNIGCTPMQAPEMPQLPSQSISNPTPAASPTTADAPAETAPADNDSPPCDNPNPDNSCPG